MHTTNKRLRCRRFHLARDVDHSGVSGTGVVAVGVVLPSGRCVMEWMPPHTSCGVYDSLAQLRAVHGHGGATRVVFVDRAAAARRR